MKPSFLLKPLLFKEWKEHRWWLIAAIILLLYGPFSTIIGFLAARQLDDTYDNLLWNVLMPTLYHVQYSSGNGGFPTTGSNLIQGQPVVSTLAVLVSMGLMIALITVERNRGSLWFTISFPIRRVELLRVKILLAVSVVLCGYLLDFLMVLACDLAAHRAVPIAVLFQWLGKNLLVSSTMMAAGLACASVVQIGFVAGLTAVLIPTLPWAVGEAVMRSVPPSNPVIAIGPIHTLGATAQGSITVAQHLSMFLRALSPTSYFSGTTSFSFSEGPPGQQIVTNVSLGHPMTIGIVLWFILLTLVGGFAGVYAYQRAPIENTGRWVQFPALVPWLFWFFCGVISFWTVSAIAANSAHINQTPYVMLAYWLVAWILLGFIVKGIRAGLSLKRAS